MDRYKCMTVVVQIIGRSLSDFEKTLAEELCSEGVLPEEIVKKLFESFLARVKNLLPGGPLLLSEISWIRVAFNNGKSPDTLARELRASQRPPPLTPSP